MAGKHSRHRTDRKQNEIVAAARSLPHTSVAVLSQVGGGVPDLLFGCKLPCPKCGHWFPQNPLAEVKNEDDPPSKQQLSEMELKFMEGWHGQHTVIKGIDDMLMLLKLKSRGF